jgi:hypothetical protein
MSVKHPVPFAAESSLSARREGDEGESIMNRQFSVTKKVIIE